MRWKDIRKREMPPQRGVLVKGHPENGTYYYKDGNHNYLDYKGQAVWDHDERCPLPVSDYPLWATVEDVEKELEDDALA